jgi:hypothetical protein
MKYLTDARIDLVNNQGLTVEKLERNAGIYENYNSVTGKGNDVHNADGYYHWGARVFIYGIYRKGLYKAQPLDR